MSLLSELGIRKSMQPVKKVLSDEVLACLEHGANDLHMVQLMTLPPHHVLLH